MTERYLSPYMRTHPYPGVRQTKDGQWEARRSSAGRQYDLGRWPTPEAARAAILLAMAENLESRAAGYRMEATRIARGAHLSRGHRGDA